MMYDVVKFTYTVHTLHTLKQPFAALAIVLIAICGEAEKYFLCIKQLSTDRTTQDLKAVNPPAEALFIIPLAKPNSTMKQLHQPLEDDTIMAHPSGLLIDSWHAMQKVVAHCCDGFSFM